jgi:hypothetical protein
MGYIHKDLRILYNGLSRLDEVAYYKDLCNRVTSYKELYELDTMPHKRSYGWLVKYCKPNWAMTSDARFDKIQQDKKNSDTSKLNEVSKISYVKRIIDSEHNLRQPLKIQFECTNGHIIKRLYRIIVKQKECSFCSYESELLKNKKDRQYKLQSKTKIKHNLKLEKKLKKVSIVSEFIDSGEYKNYINWTRSPIHSEYCWLRNGAGSEYLTNELKEKIDTISYFEYMSSSNCPYPTKENHKWCRKCKVEQHVDEFRSAYICKECALKYRQDEYYEKDNIQGKVNYHTNPMVKLHTLVKVYVNSALKGKPKSFRTKDILGLEWDTFRDYIESLFEPWMNWDNHGHGVGKWALQHIIPRTFAETEDDIYRLNYYKNLMPMDFSDNGSLKDRILRYQLNEWHYDNCGDFLDKYNDRILESMDEIYNKKQ